jgi:hypothetical protein
MFKIAAWFSWSLLLLVTACAVPKSVGDDHLSRELLLEASRLIAAAPRTPNSSVTVVLSDGSFLTGNPPSEGCCTVKTPNLWTRWRLRSEHTFFEWNLKVDFEAWVTEAYDPASAPYPVTRVEVILDPSTGGCLPRRSVARANDWRANSFYEVHTQGAPAWSCVPSEVCTIGNATALGHQLTTGRVCGKV